MLSKTEQPEPENECTDRERSSKQGRTNKRTTNQQRYEMKGELKDYIEGKIIVPYILLKYIHKYINITKRHWKHIT